MREFRKGPGRGWMPLVRERDQAYDRTHAPGPSPTLDEVAAEQRRQAEQHAHEQAARADATARERVRDATARCRHAAERAGSAVETLGASGGPDPFLLRQSMHRGVQNLEQVRSGLDGLPAYAPARPRTTRPGTRCAGRPGRP